MPTLPHSLSARLGLVAIVALGLFLLARGVRAPELPGYTVEQRPLLQRVVASGQVRSPSLARVGSEITAVVKSRHVREGDSVKPGDLVQPGRTLLEIARADSREIVVALDEKSLAPLRLEQVAQAVAAAYPAAPVPARVSFIAPAVDASRGTVDIHLDLTADAPFLRQGMMVSVNIETARLARVLVLPNDALHDLQGNRAVVFRVVAGRV